MTDEEIPTIRDMPVRSAMSETVQSVPADATATEAARHLFDSGIGSLLVGADPAPPDGIITETDFVELAATEQDPAATTVAECMSSPVTTVSATTSLGEAAGRMADEGIKKLPVVDDGTGEVVGVVTTTDIAKYLPVHEFHPEE